jgi:spore maturation protein CgeB
VQKEFDVCFVGGWSPKRQTYLEATLAVTPKVALYGGKWLKKCWNRPAILRCWKGSYIEGEDLNRLYNQSAIVLNITNWGKGEGKARSGMNMRVLEVPATGAFLFTDASLELEEFLTPGMHVGVHEGIEDFSAGLAHFFAHPEQRDAIAVAGMNHVRSRHTYDHVVQEILNAYSEFVGSPTLAGTSSEHAKSP